MVLFLGKERNRTVTQASEWSSHELRNLLNFWFNSLGLLIMHHCTCMHLWTHYVHTQNSSSSSSGCLFSLDLTLPQRQTEPPLWQTNTVKKSLRVLQTHNKSIHYLQVNSFRKEAYVIYSSMLGGCWAREKEKERWGVFRDKAGGQLRMNSVFVPNSPKRGGNQ